MYFKFIQDKKQQALRDSLATFMSFATSFMISILCYAICNLFVCFLNIDADVISVKYVMIFVALFLLIFLTFVLVYAFTKKGVIIDKNLITIKIGYFDRMGIYFKTEISINDIVSVEYMEKYKHSEVLKDYRNYNYRWFCVITFAKNTPVAKVQLNNDNIYLIPLDDVNTFVKTFNNYKK
jgi:hypothetical protein